MRKQFTFTLILTKKNDFDINLKIRVY